MSVDLKNLSKKKYIYVMYINSKYDVSLERFPVIYINKRFVYFKKGSDEDLIKTPICIIKDISDIQFEPFPCVSYYFLDKPSDEWIENIRKEFLMSWRENEKKTFMTNLEKARKTYESMLEKGMLLGYIES